MKKIFNFCMIALVAMVAFTSCSDDCNHDFIEYDYSKDIVGTWTCLEADYASALVFEADGSAVSMGVGGGDYWENVDGTFSVKNNNLVISFESGYDVDVRIDLIPNESLSIIDKEGKRHTYRYCTNDLADEILGMWVCTQTPSGKSEDMLIQTFQEDGTLITTGRVPEADDYIVNADSNYKVFGDLYIIYGKEEGTALVFKFNVSSNETTLGKMMTVTGFMPTENGVVEETSSWLRIKQNLNLTGKTYDYSDVYVTNVKGLDKDIPFHPEYTFNFAKMDGTLIDQILKSILFSIEFPDANTFKYSCRYPNPNTSMEAPMVVDGNKVTVKMSERNAAYRDIDFYMYQDADDSQLHMYLPTYSFINFYGNMQIIMMEQLGQIDTTDATAVKAVYDSLDEAVETINMSFVLKARN